MVPLEMISHISSQHLCPPFCEREPQMLSNILTCIAGKYKFVNCNQTLLWLKKQQLVSVIKMVTDLSQSQEKMSIIPRFNTGPKSGKALCASSSLCRKLTRWRMSLTGWDITHWHWLQSSSFHPFWCHCDLDLAPGQLIQYKNLKLKEASTA